MAVATFKCEFPRRQAMLRVCGGISSEPLRHNSYKTTYKEPVYVPVFVWPMPTQDGYFIVEHQDGHCQRVQPHELTFLGSKELFDQYSWEEA